MSIKTLKEVEEYLAEEHSFSTIENGYTILLNKEDFINVHKEIVDRYNLPEEFSMVHMKIDNNPNNPMFSLMMFPYGRVEFIYERNNEPIGKSDFKKTKDLMKKGLLDEKALDEITEYFIKQYEKNNPPNRDVVFWSDLGGYARFQSHVYKKFHPEATDEEVEEYRLKMIEKLKQEKQELNILNK